MALAAPPCGSPERLRSSRSRCSRSRNGRGRVHRHHLVHGVAEQEGAIERRHPRLRRAAGSRRSGSRSGSGTAELTRTTGGWCRSGGATSRRAATAASGCRGTVATVWPPANTCSDADTRVPRASGAISRGCTSIAVLRSPDSPRGSVTYRSSVHADIDRRGSRPSRPRAVASSVAALDHQLGVVEGEAVVEQRGAGVLARLDARRTQHHRHQAHAVAQRRGHQAEAGRIGMAGLQAVDARIASPAGRCGSAA